MKRMNRTLALALTALASVAFAAQDGIVLRRTLKADTTDTYKVESKAKQQANIPGQGDVETNITSGSSFVLKTLKVDDAKGVADISLIQTVDSIDADGPAGEAMKASIGKAVTLTGTLNTRSIATLKTDKLTGAQAMVAAQSSSSDLVFVSYPENAVKVGDSWDVVIPKGLAFNEDQKVTATLTGDKKVGDRDVWVISTKGTIKIDLDTAKFPDDPDATGPMANMKMHIVGPSDVTAETLVDKSTGKVIKAEIKTKATSKIEIAAYGLSIDSSTTSTTTYTLKE